MDFFVAGAVQEASLAERVKSSAMPRCFFVTGAAFRMTWTNFFVAGAVL